METSSKGWLKERFIFAVNGNLFLDMGQHNACSDALGIDEMFSQTTNGTNLSLSGPSMEHLEGSGIVPNENAEWWALSAGRMPLTMKTLLFGSNSQEMDSPTPFEHGLSATTTTQTYVYYFRWTIRLALYKGVLWGAWSLLLVRRTF